MTSEGIKLIDGQTVQREWTLSCQVCKQEKPKQDFQRNKYGFSGRCKQCSKEAKHGNVGESRQAEIDQVIQEIKARLLTLSDLMTKERFNMYLEHEWLQQTR